MRTFILLMIGGMVLASCAVFQKEAVVSPLAGKVICLDPGHGGTAEFDHFRVGPTGEREEWVNLRVGLLLKDMLEERGAKVLMSRTKDVQVELRERAVLAMKNKADVFISLHHNATADPKVNFPIIYFHGNASENEAGVQLAKCVARRIREALFQNEGPVSIVSDYTIFPGGGTAVLRHSYGIPGVIGEASFFSNPEEEQRLKKESYNLLEATAYRLALEDFFSMKTPTIEKKFSHARVSPFMVLQEADRTKDVAKKWSQDFLNARALFQKGDKKSLEKAYELFTRSARSFPDSPVAEYCHRYRAEILEKTGKTKEANMAKKRVREFYVSLK